MNQNAFKAIIWIMLGCGFTLLMTSDERMVMKVGQVLMVIALLSRLLLWLRSKEPNLQRIESAMEAPGSVLGIDLVPNRPAISEPSSSILEDGRSPIERLLNEEASKR